MNPPRYNAKEKETIYSPLSHLIIFEKPLDRFIIDPFGIISAHEHVLRTVGRGSGHILAVTIVGFILLALSGSLDTVAEVSFLL